VTGTVLFGSTRFDQFIATTGDFALVPGSTVHRVGSFFVDPNWNGTFFITILPLSLGLFVTSSSFLKKALYLAEALLMLPALLFTYSNGAWISIFAGIIVFVVFVGQTRYRVLLLLLIVIIAMVVIMYFPSDLNLQLQHATRPDALSSRIGAWQTGIQVISAFPLTGVGLGLQAYLERAEPYRVPAQYIPLAHPHNSYLELGAMAGLPVLIVFMALLFSALRPALRNWTLAETRVRSLLGAGIAAILTLSINSWSINAWTLPPLAATGWLILGAISSPLLAKGQSREIERKELVTQQQHIPDEAR
jgi:putative inorganic carbon (HCO3(-)) transporter